MLTYMQHANMYAYIRSYVHTCNIHWKNNPGLEMTDERL